MKRIHLFEFEDLPWFPNNLRICMTRLIVVMHRILGTSEPLKALIRDLIKQTGQDQLVDLCSGSGGPMLAVYRELRNEPELKDIKLTLTDLFPNDKLANTINLQDGKNLSYRLSPLDATKVDAEVKGIRTMISSFHHMPPPIAKGILKNAQESGQPICIFEISDNAFPIWANFLALPINFVMCLFVTPLVRPMSWQQLVFTYLIPILPLAFAWDGAVSNARTYTLNDLDELIADLPAANYHWGKGKIKSKQGHMLFLTGRPA